MKNTHRNNTALNAKNTGAAYHPFLILLLSFALGSTTMHAAEVQESDPPIIIQQVVEKAKKNTNWKTALLTGKHEQVVFMNISPSTNPKNEIGIEVHPFDQVILVVQGEGKAVLNGKTSPVKEGDLIFIPEGVSHNVVNADKNKELKIISFYSDTDIPKGATYKIKADQKED